MQIPAKIYRKGKYFSRDAGHRLGLYNDFYKSARGSRIVIYHGLCEKDHTRFNPIFLTVKTFEQHLKLYKKHFNVISLDDYYTGKFSADRFNICITFDDGFANNYKYALPLLEQYKLPATFFVTAIRADRYDILWNDFLGIIQKYGPKKIDYKGEAYRKGQHNKYISLKSGLSLAGQLRSRGFADKDDMMELLYPLVPFKTDEGFEDYWLQMTEEQIRELSKSPFATIGAHGHYHNDLTKISAAATADELRFSKSYLENVTGKQVKSFAFPYGAYNAEVVGLAKQAGYEQLLAMDFSNDDDYKDSFMRERFTVNPFISANNQMYANVTRSYE